MSAIQVNLSTPIALVFIPCITASATAITALALTSLGLLPLTATAAITAGIISGGAGQFVVGIATLLSLHRIKIIALIAITFAVSGMIGIFSIWSLGVVLNFTLSLFLKFMALTIAIGAGANGITFFFASRRVVDPAPVEISRNVQLENHVVQSPRSSVSSSESDTISSSDGTEFRIEEAYSEILHLTLTPLIREAGKEPYVKIMQITEGCPAWKARLRSGDMIPIDPAVPNEAEWCGSKFATTWYKCSPLAVKHADGEAFFADYPEDVSTGDTRMDVERVKTQLEKVIEQEETAALCRGLANSLMPQANRLRSSQ